ncbi:MAG: phytanoyl-CoA dioxygenase family protein [Planctomycetes bacterium]|nr:phytanoyl-CoA dioxygenase family protein [Planctomycetota bacterium]
MLFTTEQLDLYRRDGYAIITCPWLEPLTRDCLAAVAKVEVTPDQRGKDGMGNHARLKPQMPESYWSQLDHSLPFLRVILHDEIVELLRQVNADDDIYMRNGGINDMAVGHAVAWHRDYDWDRTEVMHYFTGGRIANGCLRVVPGSHRGTRDQWKVVIDKARQEQGIKGEPRSFAAEVDAVLPGEVSLEVEPNQLIVRSTAIYHATHTNLGPRSRMMSHFVYREHEADDHRFRWENYLTPVLLDALTPKQKRPLWLGREFEIAEKFKPERAREDGKVSWSVI